MLRFAAGEPELPTVSAKGPAQGTFSQWRSCSPQLLKAAESCYKDRFPWSSLCMDRLRQGSPALLCCAGFGLHWGSKPRARDHPSAQGWGPLPSQGWHFAQAPLSPQAVPEPEYWGWWRSQLCPQQSLPCSIRVSASGTAVDASAGVHCSPRATLPTCSDLSKPSEGQPQSPSLAQPAALPRPVRMARLLGLGLKQGATECH